MNTNEIQRCKTCGASLEGASAGQMLCHKCEKGGEVSQTPETIALPRPGQLHPPVPPEIGVERRRGERRKGDRRGTKFDRRVASRDSSKGEVEKRIPGYFGQYEILEEISRGGMGVVYKARQKKLDRIVALKVLIAGEHASQDEVERFYREAQSAAKLRHPNVVPIYDVGIHEGRHYFTMEYIDGQPLHRLIRAGQVTIDRAVDIIGQVADVIAYAHSEGIIHRDIKPANVLIDKDGRARVTDFGLAKGVRSDSSLTRSGMTMGTPNYMSIEQARGDTKAIDQQSDVYALGAVLYEMLTGRPPFVGESDIDIILKVLNEDPIPPRKLNPAVPVELQLICLKAMEKEKGRRYRNVQEFLSDIRRYKAGEPITARPTRPIYRIYKKLKKQKVLAAGVVLLILSVSILVASIVSYLGAEKPTVGSGLLISRSPQEVWELVFEDSFDGDLGKNWKPLTDGWEISSGILRSKGKGVLAVAEKVKGDVRVEFDIAFEKVGGTGKFFLVVCSGEGISTGYRLMLAVSQDELMTICVQGDRGMLGYCTRQVETGKSTCVRFEKICDEISVYVDGEKVLDVLDVLPPVEDGRDLCALVSAGAAVILHRFNLYRGKEEELTGPLAFGKRCIQKGLYDIAIEDFREVLEASPSPQVEAEALYLIGVCLVRKAVMSGEPDDYARAADALRKFIEKHPDNRRVQVARRLLGRCLAGKGDIASLDEVLTQLGGVGFGEGFPPFFVPQAQQMVTLELAGEDGSFLQEGHRKRITHRVSELDLGDDGEGIARAKLDLAEECRDKAQFEISLEACREVQNEFEEDRDLLARALYEEGVTLFNSGQFSEAARAFERFLALRPAADCGSEPDVGKVFTELARTMGFGEDFGIAIQNVREEFHASGKHDMRVENFLEELTAKLDQEWKWLERHSSAQELLYECHINTGAYDAALALVESMYSDEDDPITSARAGIMRARVYRKQQQYELAEKELKRILKSESENLLLVPVQVWALAEIQVLYHLSERYEAAIETYESFLAKHPQMKELFADVVEMGMALAHIGKGDVEQARRIWEKMASRSTFLGDGTLQVVARFFLGEIQLEEFLVRGCQTGIFTESVLYYLAGLRERVAGRNDEARRLFEKSLRCTVGKAYPYELVQKELEMMAD